MGKHKPKPGTWVPDPQRKGSFTIIGKITARLLGKKGGWDSGR